MLSKTSQSGDRPQQPSRVYEQELIERCKQRQPGAFDELVLHFEKRVFNFAYRIAGNYDDAGDVSQEAFLRVFNSINSFRGDANFSTWLYRIVKNVYLDSRKKLKAHRTISLDENIDLDEASVARQIPDEGPLPADIVENREMSEAAQQALRQLPDYQRMIMVMYHFEQLSYEEIAQVLNLPIGTVKSRLNRARISLAQILKSNPELFGQ